MKKTLIAAAMLCAAFSAAATGNHNGPSTAGGSANAGAVGVGIGQGGDGGSAAAVSSNRNRNTNAQQQGQEQSSRNTNRVRSTVNAPVNVSVSVPQGSAPQEPQALRSAAVESEKGGDLTIVDPTDSRIPVSTAYAAPLTASNGTCMGSSSGGGQGAGFGLSIATTWTDSSCDIRYDAEALRAAGLNVAAIARLCQKADIAKAMESAGTPCPGSKRQATAVSVGSPPMMPVISEQAAQAQYTDPIIRSRLGLPPL